MSSWTTSPTYNLVATWVDGSQVTAPPVHVNSVVAVLFSQTSPTAVIATFVIFAENATAVSVSNASIIFSSEGDRWQSSAQVAQVAPFVPGSSEWVATFAFSDIDGKAMNYPNAGVAFTYHCDGSDPYTNNTTIMWRGQFDS
jgi:hypothetical protein